MVAEPGPDGALLVSVDCEHTPDLVAAGGDLLPSTLVRAYRSGVFPMPVSVAGPGGSSSEVMGWWSPLQRGVLPVPGLRVSRSLSRSLRRYRCSVNSAFTEVITACADPSREHGWITEDIAAAYLELHHRGIAHSVEAWDEQGRLAGGLYGVAIGGLFAGESMFTRAVDASKVALVHLVQLLNDDYAGQRLLDVQWSTPHLESLGCVQINRAVYAQRLQAALRLPLPVAFTAAGADIAAQ